MQPAFSHFFSFPFDPFQVEAMDHIAAGRSVMVSAPTSSGKTVVAEYALWRALGSGSRAIYTTPIKALSNQKRHDLEQLFPGQVGLLTGDRSENADAPIVVMTTEVLRNMLVEDAAPLPDTSTVVFDEVHYLADPGRGTVWEEAIITCPPHIQLVCLSATIANAEEIARWIGETHREIALIRHDERPVPLEHLFFSGGALRVVRDGSGERRSLLTREGKAPPPRPADVVRALARSQRLPAIWFAFSRRAVEQAAAAIGAAAPRPSPDKARIIDEAIAWTLASIPAEDRGLPQMSALIELLRRGVGFHHAGLLPPLKELVESLFTRNLLSVVAATDSLAVGINMPARTVVISSLTRPFGGVLSPNDFRQLTGRAGRRGIDERGSVVMLSSPYRPFEELYRQVCGPLEPIESTFRLRYSTLLSALEGQDGRLEHLVRSSLRQYQMRATMRQAEQQARELAAAVEGGAGDDPDLGDYLQLQSRLSAAEKEQRRARSARSKGAKSRGTQERYERAKAERQRLSDLVRSHPAHLRAQGIESGDPERLAALRRINKLRAVADQARRECEEDASETAEAVRAVLWELGYIDSQGLTHKARGLREIVAASGIVISELYEDGSLQSLGAAELAEAMSWFAADVDRRRDNRLHLPGNLARLRRHAGSTYTRIAEIERGEGIELAQGPSSWFYGVALAWCRGDSVARIASRVEVGEGDIVSLLNKTVDLLDQFEQMVERRADWRMLETSAQARALLVRGLVAMVREGTR